MHKDEICLIDSSERVGKHNVIMFLIHINSYVTEVDSCASDSKNNVKVVFTAMDVEYLRYQFEDGYDGVVTKNRFKIGVRHIQMVYMFASSIAMGAVRGSVGIAVLAMNDVTRRNDTYIQIHDWDKRIQGTILSAFFLGYALLLVPADLILRKMGGKAVATTILAVNGAIYLTLPTIVNRGGWIATSNAFFMMGMTQACLTPVNQILLEKWLPPNEKLMCSRIVYGGIFLGILIALPISGILAETRLGWELIFYSLAMLTLTMAIICGLLTASSPEQHPAVGDGEKEYVNEALSLYRKRSVPVPWRNILKTRQFWAVSCAHAASNAIFVFYLVEIPAYLRELNISFKDCAFFSLLPFITMWLMYILTSPTLDWMCRLGYISFLFSESFFRKLINGLGAFGTVIGLTILPNLVPDWGNLAIIVLSASLGLAGFQFSGFLKSLKDMSNNFSGTLLLMTSAVASVVGALTPLVIGFILGDESNALKKWRVVFLLLAGFCVLCNVVYTAFGSSERQEWDETRNRHKFGYHNVTTTMELEEMNSRSADKT